MYIYICAYDTRVCTRQMCMSMQTHVPDRQKGICMLICHQYANFSDMASCNSLRARLKLPKHAEAFPQSRNPRFSYSMWPKHAKTRKSSPLQTAQGAPFLKHNLNNNPRLCTSLQDGTILKPVLDGLASGSLPDWLLVGNVGIYYLRTI